MEVYLFAVISFFIWSFGLVQCDFPTTLQGPFNPVTAPPDNDTLSRSIIDLPDTDPRVQTTVEPFHPEQISVSLSSDYDSVWISWVTGDYQIGQDIIPLDSNSVGSVVQYGKLGMQPTSEAVGYSLVYNQRYDFDDSLNYSSGILHHVRLSGLEPGVMYQYQCGDPWIPAMSDVFYFSTMPASNPESYPRRIAVVGDLGLSYNTSTTLSHLLATHPDLLLLVGGVSYSDLYTTDGFRANISSDYSPLDQTFQPRWDYWGRFMQPLTAKVPTMVVAGKHEIERQAGDYAFVAYSSRFAFPSEESGSSSPLYYSFNAGGVHFIVLNPYTAYDNSSDQYIWLETDLNYVNRSETPWLVATWYSPWYSTFQAHYREAECMRMEMEALLYNNNVDIVFNSHVHAYERSNRVYNYNLDPCGPVYITIGSGGCAEEISIAHTDDPGSCPDPSSTGDDIIGNFCPVNLTYKGEFCSDRQPEYSAYRESSFGHGTLEVSRFDCAFAEKSVRSNNLQVTNETHALWSWNRNEDFYETAADIVYIVREPERCLMNAK